ncbi:MAG TPA: hypothetical protein VFV16_07775 [Candidatus Nitrosotalea sp.]|nr:hypothetical protein [Candidatus Nitrosotalea sp.]
MVSKKIVIIAIIVAAILVSVYLDQSFSKVQLQNVTPEKKNPYVKEYSLPVGSAPNGLVADKTGLVWVTAQNATLYSVDPSSGQVEKYLIKSGTIPYTNAGVNSTMVWAIVQDDTGNIWLSPLGAKTIWRFDPSSHAFISYVSKTGAPFQIKADKKGEVWFTTLRVNTVGVIKPQNNDYTISTFDTGSDTNPAGIFLQNNSVWIANVGTQNIFKYVINQKDNLAQDITLAQKTPKDNVTLFSAPTDLLVDKNVLWLTEHGTSFLTSYDLTDGKITRYPTSQNNFHTTTLPFWIRGVDDPKVLWFNEHQGNKIGRFDVSNKTLIEYDIPSLPKDGYLTYPLNISQDPRDEKVLWFSEWNTDKVGVVNGNMPIPFDLDLNVTQVVLSHNKIGVVDVTITGASHYSDTLSLNTSSSITPTAELGNLTVKFSSDMASPSHGTIHVSLNGSQVNPGNYTLGISASDGFVTKTKFLDLRVIQ